METDNLPALTGDKELDSKLHEFKSIISEGTRLANESCFPVRMAMKAFLGAATVLVAVLVKERVKQKRNLE